ncbi:MAG: M24 family metallopeptidase, partial [bacterium]|nr:M24 family metallopeptidase [bacterium]
GADKPAFETILAAGPHACDCHHMPDSMKLRRGVSVLIDWGANIGGYCSDMTRTIFLGEIPKKIGAIYEVVSEARKAAVKTLRAGAMLKSPDIAARKVISDSGHEFIHSIGHGLGREVHESPFLGHKTPGRLKSGMVVTIEPGIYLPGVGGVRLEDDFLITHKGYKCLGTMTTDMRSMVLS